MVMSFMCVCFAYLYIYVNLHGPGIGEGLEDVADNHGTGVRAFEATM